MTVIRPAAVAGMFYPAGRAELTDMIAEMLMAARDTVPAEAPNPKSIIAPHAGYIYSGPVAALAYARLTSPSIERIVLLGPTHRVAVRGIALPGADAFATPLGEVVVDPDGVQALAGHPLVVTSPRVHSQEHSLEVHLPFLQTVAPHAPVLPLAVGDAAATEVADVLDLVWGWEETVVVVSSDLSHYLTHEDAVAVDDVTITQILALDGTIDHTRACGASPVNGLLEAARRREMSTELLGRATSGDTAGGKDRVVGYASFALCENGESAA